MTRKVTALKLQKRNRNRVNLYLDGEFALGLARIVAGWLEVGQELSEEKIAELQSQDEHEVAYQRALNFLSYRIRSEAEIRRNLQKHQVAEESCHAVITRLQRANLVNDAEFAQTWVENRSEFRPRGRRALRMELRKKGLNQEIIEQALEKIDEDTLAYQAARKKVRKLENLEWAEFRKKLGGFLARRGFNYATISPIVSQVWAELDNDQSNNDIENEV